MFFHYLNDKKSWLLFYGASLGFVDYLIWLDKGMTLSSGSLLYMNVLLILGLLVFLIWRFQKETKYAVALSALMQEQSIDWQEALPDPIFSRDELMNDLLRHTLDEYRKEFARLNANYHAENDYTASLVHEVKAPLTAMKMLIDANNNSPVMRKIDAEWLRVHLLIDRQLYISRLPTLASDYIMDRISLQSLIPSEIRELSSWCIEKNIAVEYEGLATEVLTDSKWCRFIIRQLLTNAVKYSPIGGVITIKAIHSSEGQVVLTIKDEGPGIPAHELPRIFDKGFTGGTGRLHNAATGLGLYLAQSIADKIGIHLAVETDEGHGTEMRMHFSVRNEFDKTLT